MSPHRWTEAEFQETVMQLAKYRGWMVTHFRPARTEHGWVTPLSGDRGFPDLVLARNGKVVFAELKTDKGRITADQQKWLTAIGDCYIWRPSDLEEIKEVLR